MLTLLVSAPWISATAGDTQLLAAQHPLTLDAAPGAIVHLAFIVHNDQPQERQFAEQLHPPEGWHLVFPATDFSLPALGHELRLFSLQVSPSAAVAQQRIHYTVSDRDSGHSQSITTHVQVAATEDLTLLWRAEPPRWLFQNHQEILHAQIINTGNTHQHLEIDVKTPMGVLATTETDTLALAPGEQTTLAIQLSVSEPIAHRNTAARIALQMRSEDTTYRLEHRFEQLVIQSDIDRHVHLPLQFHTTLQRINGHLDLESTLSGGGPLDDAQQHHLHLLIRRGTALSLPNIHSFRQVVAYQGPHGEATLGDFFLALSPLTSTGRLGRGAALVMGDAAQPWRVGVHTLRMKSDQDHYERAIHLETSLGPALRHQLVVAQASGVDAASADGQHHRWMSSTLRSRPQLEHDWQMEMANSRTVRAQQAPRYGQAWQLQGAGRLAQTPALQYRFSGWRIDQAFAHPQSGEAFYHLDLSGQLHDTLRARMHGYHHRIETNTLNQRLGVEIGRRIRPNWTTELGHQVRTDRTATTPTSITHHQHIGLRHHGPRGSVSGRVEWRDARRTRSTWTAHYRPSSEFSLTAGHSRSTDRRDQPVFETSQRQGRWLALRWRPIDLLTLDLRYTERVRVSNRASVLFQPSTQQHNHVLSARLHYAISRHQRGWLEAQRHRGPQGHWDHSLRAGWSVAFNAPIRPQRHIGSLHGHLDPPPRQAVRVRVAGQSTLSDQEGRFVIHALPSGPQQIELDRATLPAGLTVEDPGSLMAMIPNGGGSHTTIQLVPAAGIRGHIALAPSAWSGLDAVPRMLIRLRNDDSTYHTISDQQGRFVFEPLRPGRWIIEIDRAQWPARHHIDAPIQHLVLVSGSHHAVVFNLIPEHRAIQFIDEGRLDD